MKRAVVLATLVIAAGLVVWLAGRRLDPALEPMSVERLADNLFVISGAGGNTAVFLHTNGVVLVDTKVSGTGARLLEQIRRVTDKPVTHILNTHAHFDHVGSNASFSPIVEIVAQENAAWRMLRMEEFSASEAKHGLADRRFSDRLTLLSGDEAIDLYYFGAAHTDGDAFIVFRGPRVMHAGDTFPGMNPIVRDGGSAEAYPATMRGARDTITNVDRVIPGHGPVATWQAFADDIEQILRQRTR